MIANIADKIKMFWGKREFTRPKLAKRPEITRSGVNTWDMNFSSDSVFGKNTALYEQFYGF